MAAQSRIPDMGRAPGHAHDLSGVFNDSIRFDRFRGTRDWPDESIRITKWLRLPGQHLCDEWYECMINAFDYSVTRGLDTEYADIAASVASVCLKRGADSVTAKWRGYAIASFLEYSTRDGNLELEFDYTSPSRNSSLFESSANVTVKASVHVISREPPGPRPQVNSVHTWPPPQNVNAFVTSVTSNPDNAADSTINGIEMACDEALSELAYDPWDDESPKHNSSDVILTGASPDTFNACLVSRTVSHGDPMSSRVYTQFLTPPEIDFIFYFGSGHRRGGDLGDAVWSSASRIDMAPLCVWCLDLCIGGEAHDFRNDDVIKILMDAANLPRCHGAMVSLDCKTFSSAQWNPLSGVEPNPKRDLDRPLGIPDADGKMPRSVDDANKVIDNVIGKLCTRLAELNKHVIIESPPSRAAGSVFAIKAERHTPHSLTTQRVSSTCGASVITWCTLISA